MFFVLSRLVTRAWIQKNSESPILHEESNHRLKNIPCPTFVTTDKTKTYCENIFNVFKIMTVHYLVAKERNVKNLIRTDGIVLVSSYKSRYFLFHIIVFKNIYLYNNLFVSLRLIILTFLHEFYLLS